MFRTCPRLLKLRLLHNVSYTPLPPPLPPPPPPTSLTRISSGQRGSVDKSIVLPPIISNYLEHFELVADLDERENGYCPELSMILMSPKLKSVTIEKCFYLVDKMILDAFESHGFENLKSLTLIDCNQLSKTAFVDVFLSRSNSLKQLTLLYCEKLCTASNRDEWLLLARQRNWDFFMELTI